jgi:cytochrome d ubiquinol oxidase subunit I
VLYVGLEEPDHEEPDTDRPARPLSAAHVSFEYNSDTADHKGGH